MKDTTIKRYLLKYSKLNNYNHEYRLNVKLPNYLNDVMVGLLLYDGSLEKSSNHRLSVIMFMKNCSYLLHLYNLFEPYIDSGRCR
jgi:hypothetical protein